MACTTHGYHIPGTVNISQSPLTVVKCGGPGICTQCSKEANAYYVADSTKTDASEHADDNTLQKVYMALWKAGLSYDEAMNAVNEMQNSGILFRQRR